jgi:hypothetical protein
MAPPRSCDLFSSKQTSLLVGYTGGGGDISLYFIFFV